MPDVEVVGSVIRMRARILGIALGLDERVTERDVPRRKQWETIGTPRLIVISHYRMGYEIAPMGNNCTLRVFIHYDLPARAPGRWLGRLFGKYYAQWCTRRMVVDAVNHFAGGRSWSVGHALTRDNMV